MENKTKTNTEHKVVELEGAHKKQSLSSMDPHKEKAMKQWRLHTISLDNILEI